MAMGDYWQRPPFPGVKDSAMVKLERASVDTRSQSAITFTLST